MYTINKKVTFHPVQEQGYRSSRTLLIICLLIAALLCLTTSSNTASAAIYYLDDVNGFDSNLGTSESPWQTLAKALSEVQGGDTVILRSGNYGFFDDTTARTDFVTFQADNGATPVFSQIRLGYRTGPYNAYLKFQGIKIDTDSGNSNMILLDDVNNVQIRDCEFVGYDRYRNLEPRLSGDNIVFERCEVHYEQTTTYESDPIYKTRGIHIDGHNFTVRDCYFHDFSSSGMIVDGSGLVERCHIFRQSNKWPGFIDFTTTVASGGGTGRTVLTISEGSSVDDFYNGTWISINEGTRCEVVDYVGATKTVTMSDARNFSDGDPVRIFNESKHGSGLSVFNVSEPPGLTIRNCIIHAINNRGIYVYGDASVPFVINNLVVENCLVYDSSGGFEMRTSSPEAIIGTGCKFNNNTIIGKWEEAPPGTLSSRYMPTSGVLLDLWDSSYDGNFEFYNNVVIGPVEGLSNRIARVGNNIVFTTDRNWHPTDGYDALANSKILCQGHDDWLQAGEGWNPEEDFFIQYPMFLGRGPYELSNWRGTFEDYRPQDGSFLINFGDPANHSRGNSLGSIGPDGFIRDDGLPRDANHHTAGCYEYVPSDPNIQRYSIMARAGSGGQINPSGITQVISGYSQTYTITPNIGYHILDVVVDSNSVGAVSGYTFTNVTANHMITVIFAINTYTLNITAVNGSVTWEPNKPGYNHGETVILTATADPGYYLLNWLGDASGSSNPITIVMDADKSVTANFAIYNTYTLNINAVNGSVTREPNKPGYNHGETVILTATANPGYYLLNWSGDASGSSNPVTIVMDANKSVTANFAVDVYYDIDGLVGYWKFDEASGIVAVDSSGNGITGTLVNGPIWTTGKINGALSFDGIDDYVEIGAGDIAPPWTASFWVKREDSLNVNAALLESSNYSLKLEQYRNTNQVGFTEYGVADYIFNYEAPIGSWVHLVFVANQTEIMLYVDGSLIDTVAGTIFCPMAQISSVIRPVKGVIDEIHIYNKAITESEILDLYSGRRTYTCDFNDGDFAGWPTVDEGSESSPSSWSAATGEMVQSSNIYEPPMDESDITKLGTYAWCAAGTNWGDYSVNLTIRSEDDDAIGVMFRYLDNDNYYRFSWDMQRRYRRLVKKQDGVFTLLAEDRIPYVIGRSYYLQIVAQGVFLQISIDGTVIFSIIDDSLAFGSIALYCWANADSCFDDIVVKEIPVIFTDNFNDGDFVYWPTVDEGNVSSPSSWSAASGEMVQSSNIYEPPTDRSGLAKLGTYAWCAAGAYWVDYSVNLTIKSEDDDAMGVMFHHQDNDNYYRFSWDKQRGYRRLVKKQDGIFTLLAEDNVPYGDPNQSYYLEIIAQGAFLQISIDGTVIFSVIEDSVPFGSIALYSWANVGSCFDDIVVEGVPVIWTDDFNDGDFVYWPIVDEGNMSSPSSWSAASGEMVQSSNIYEPPTDQSGLAKLGTYAWCAAGTNWIDYSVNLTIKSEDDDALGVMFRYQDNDNYYRFSWDKYRKYRRLVKKQDGVFTLLAEDGVPYGDPNQSYQLGIVAQGAFLQISVDDTVIFSVIDESLAFGSIALYSWANVGSCFDDIAVKEIPVIFTDDFNDGDFVYWPTVDEGNVSSPSLWSAATGEMVQSSNIYELPTDRSGLAKLGTYAWCAAGTNWIDYSVDLKIKSEDDDAIGVMFRYQDNENYYRFSWDKYRKYRRLVKKQDGVFTLLAEDSVPYGDPNQSYQLGIVAQGAFLQISIDGTVVFSVIDDSLAFGSIALYSWANSGSCFDDIVVEGF